MSANNWRVCPKCKLESEKVTKSSYGKVSEDEYLVILRKSQEEGNTTDMREDYEIGTDEDGWFSVSYSCYCTNCHFRFDYSYSQQLDLKKVE